MSDRDLSAIATWDATQDPRDAEPPSAPTKYRCLNCAWHGYDALTHHRATKHAHAIVLRDAPDWGPVPFGCCEVAQPLGLSR